MDKEKIIKLENYLFGAMKDGVAADTVAGIIGVLIGLKLAMVGNFSEGELEKADLNEFVEMIDDLNLKVVFFHHQYFSMNKMVTAEDFYISKDIKTANRTHDAFLKLWSTMDDYGQIINLEEWRKITREIGKLLGYPKTAVDDFIKDSDFDDEERMKRMERNHYYAHSAKYEEREFKTYDYKLNQAISKYAPKTTECLTKNKDKRWL